MPDSHIHVLDHALVAHHLTVVRDRTTPSPLFRASLAQLATMISVSATADLALRDLKIETPIRSFVGKRLRQRIGLVPILRAGVGMVEAVLKLIPTAEVWHLGLYRDESTAEPVHYYSKLPPRQAVDVALILDPMLATGGSACMACQSLTDWGVTEIRLLSVIAAPEGIQKVTSEFSGVRIFTCAVDERLNDEKFIVPGLGDAGDRLFNTV